MVEDETQTARRDPRPGQGFLTDIWYFVALASELKPGKLTRHQILGEPVMLGRGRDGALVALRDICPHRAAPLSAGGLHREADGSETVECPYHGWRFSLDGACRAIPALVAEQDFDVARIRVRSYPVAESQGMVFLWVAANPRAAEPSEPPPVLPGVVGGRPKAVHRVDFESHVDHAAAGLMDPAHGPYVHQQWWWRTKASQHDKAKRFEPRHQGFTMVRHEPSKNSRAYAILGGEPLTEITFVIPGLRWEHITVGRRQVLSLTCLTPVHETRTRVTQVVWSDHWALTLLRPLLMAAVRKFLRQDSDIVRLQREGLKHDPSLLWIDDADRQAKWYQQLKREWTASRREGRPFVNPVRPATLRWRS